MLNRPYLRWSVSQKRDHGAIKNATWKIIRLAVRELSFKSQQYILFYDESGFSLATDCNNRNIK